MMPATAAHHMRRVANNAKANITNVGSANANNANTNKANANMPRVRAATNGAVARRPRTAASMTAKPKPTARVKADPADDKTCALLLAFFRKPDLARLYSREKTLAKDLRAVVQQLIVERDDARRELEAMRRRESEMETQEKFDEPQRRDSFASTASTNSTPSSVGGAAAASPVEASPVTVAPALHGTTVTETAPVSATPTTMFEKMAVGYANDPLMASMWNDLRGDPALASLHTPIDTSGDGDDLVSCMRRRLRAIKYTKPTASQATATQVADTSAKASATMFDLMAKGYASDAELNMMWHGMRDDPALAALHTPFDTTGNGGDVVLRLRLGLQAVGKTSRVATQPTRAVKINTPVASSSPPRTMFDSISKGSSSDSQLSMMWGSLRDDPALASLHLPVAGAADGTDLLSRIRRKVALVKARNARIAEAKRRREDKEPKVELWASAQLEEESQSTEELPKQEVTAKGDTRSDDSVADGSAVEGVQQSSISSNTAAVLASATRVVTANDEFVQTESQAQTQTTTTMFDMIAQGHARDRLQSFLWECLRDDPALAALHTPIDTTGHSEDLVSRIRRKVREVEAANRARETRQQLRATIHTSARTATTTTALMEAGGTRHRQQGRQRR